MIIRRKHRTRRKSVRDWIQRRLVAYASSRASVNTSTVLEYFVHIFLIIFLRGGGRWYDYCNLYQFVLDCLIFCVKSNVESVREIPVLSISCVKPTKRPKQTSNVKKIKTAVLSLNGSPPFTKRRVEYHAGPTFSKSRESLLVSYWCGLGTRPKSCLK